MAKEDVVEALESVPEAPKDKKVSATPVADRLRKEGADIDNPEFYNLDLEAEKAAAKRKAEKG